MAAETKEQRLERVNAICTKIRELQDLLVRYDNKYLDSPLTGTDTLMIFIWNRAVYERNHLEEAMESDLVQPSQAKHLVKS